MKTRLGYHRLLKAIEATNGHMGARAVAVVNQALTLRNWLIGSHIVEYEQNGLDRAKYGERLLDRLSEDLKKRGIKGLDVRGLRDCRLFFRFYPQIRGSLPPEFVPSLPMALIRGSLTPESKRIAPASSSTPNRALERGLARAPSPLNADVVLRFSWTHILEFVRLEDPWKRAFYENECLKGRWSVRQLQRQIETLLVTTQVLRVLPLPLAGEGRGEGGGSRR